MKNENAENNLVPLVPTHTRGTVGQNSKNVGQAWDNAGTETVPNDEHPKVPVGQLKALAQKILNSSVPLVPHPMSGTVGQDAKNVGQSRDSGETTLSQTVGQGDGAVGQDFVAPDNELQESQKCLEAAHISIAVWEDGSMRVVTNAGEASRAAKDGATVYTAGEMFLYVNLSEAERRIMRELKGLRQGGKP